MIEYKVHGFQWTRDKNYLNIITIRINDVGVKIDGILKNTYNKDFEEEYNKAIVWDKLND